MTIKKGSFIKMVMIIIALLAPMFMHMNFYKINDSELAYDLGEYLKKNELSIIEKQEISNDGDKYIVVNFETGELFGVSLLIKGINSKYCVLDTSYSDDMIKSVKYGVRGDNYNVIFSEGNFEKKNPNSTTKEQVHLQREIISKTALALFFTVVVSFGICFLVIISSGGKYRISDTNIHHDDQYTKLMKPW